MRHIKTEKKTSSRIIRGCGCERKSFPKSDNQYGIIESGTHWVLSTRKTIIPDLESKSEWANATMEIKTFPIFCVHVSFGHRLFNWVHTIWVCVPYALSSSFSPFWMISMLIKFSFQFIRNIGTFFLQSF